MTLEEVRFATFPIGPEEDSDVALLCPGHVDKRLFFEVVLEYISDNCEPEREWEILETISMEMVKYSYYREDVYLDEDGDDERYEYSQAGPESGQPYTVFNLEEIGSLL